MYMVSGRVFEIICFIVKTITPHQDICLRFILLIILRIIWPRLPGHVGIAGLAEQAAWTRWVGSWEHCFAMQHQPNYTVKSMLNCLITCTAPI